MTGFLTGLDWSIIAIYLIVIMAIGIIMSKRAGRSTGDFFLSGRKLPWYIAGTSMVATTFAADTPLAVTELVAKNGIAGNWFWWNFLFGGIFTVFFFAKLWRRSGIMTDAEFVSIRYSGKAASFLRGFRAVYIGIFMNMIVIAWVNLAMVKILTVMFPELTFFGINQICILGLTFSAHLLTVGCLMLFVALYSSLSGLWGVSITDTFQFVVKMTGCIVLAIVAVNHEKIGGIAGLKEKLPEWAFNFMPAVGNSVAEGSATTSGLLKMSVTALVAYLGVQWWSSWYPGAEPGGGGYVAQRMMSAKNEKHSLLATLWFNIANYTLRTWPWVIVALCSVILYPDLPDTNKGEGFIMVIRDFLPAGLLGLLMAAFLAAYMSTIASQTVWGTSYIINDLYRPFIKPNAEERYYVKIARIVTYLLMLLSLIVVTQFDRISDAWKFVLICSGGIGPVLLLRWFWWRVNAWSEISAMLAPYIIYPILKFKYNLGFEETLLIIVAWSTVVWLVVTYFTKPSDEEKLVAFYTKVHPGGIGWRRISDKLPNVQGNTGYIHLFVNWIAGCILVLCSLFGFGKIIFGDYLSGFIFLAIAIIAGAVIYRNFSKIGWEKAVR